jgi:hypothetical protein
MCSLKQQPNTTVKPLTIHQTKPSDLVFDAAVALNQGRKSHLCTTHGNNVVDECQSNSDV